MSQTFVIKECEQCKQEYDLPVKGYDWKKRKFCDNSCRADWLKGRKLSEEHKGNIAQSMIGKNSGTKTDPQKKFDGFTTVIRTLGLYRNWRLEVLERDGNKCCECGSAENLHVDHIKPLAAILKEKELKTIGEVIGCIEIWDMDNAQTLCFDCHKKTETFGKKVFTSTNYLAI